MLTGGSLLRDATRPPSPDLASFEERRRRPPGGQKFATACGRHRKGLRCYGTHHTEDCMTSRREFLMTGAAALGTAAVARVWATGRSAAGGEYPIAEFEQ